MMIYYISSKSLYIYPINIERGYFKFEIYLVLLLVDLIEVSSIPIDYHGCLQANQANTSTLPHTYQLTKTHTCVYLSLQHTTTGA